MTVTHKWVTTCTSIHTVLYLAFISAGGRSTQAQLWGTSKRPKYSTCKCTKLLFTAAFNLLFKFDVLIHGLKYVPFPSLFPFYIDFCLPMVFPRNFNMCSRFLFDTHLWENADEPATIVFCNEVCLKHWLHSSCITALLLHKASWDNQK